MGSAVISHGYMNRRRIIIMDFLNFLKKDSFKYSSLLNLVGTPSNFPTNAELIENVWVCFSGNERKGKQRKLGS